MEIYWYMFWILLCICILLYFYTKQTVKVPDNAAFKTFQKSYLLVYFMAMGGDWLQGPYVYALYEHFGMSSHHIDILFLAGFGSSALFGTFVGSAADKYGRRAACILYGCLYAMACVTKHFPNFWILLAGRILGGISTSILFSAFESWLVCEHNKRGFSQELLPILFSRATLGNSLVAISAGHIAQVFADLYGYVSPFDVSFIVLTAMIVTILNNWTENYGDSNASLPSNFATAFRTMIKDPNIMLLGLVQAFFEGSMYTFVLKWTPALTPKEADQLSLTGHIPHGLIFASFMVSVMIGSLLFKIFTRITAIESFLRYVLLVAAASLALPIFLPSGSSCVFLGFCLFEICVGLFWPSLGTLKGVYLPESVRSTLMNFFRIPLNLVVMIILVQDLDMNVIFSCCVLFLFIAFASQNLLHRNFQRKSNANGVEMEEYSKQVLSATSSDDVSDG